MRYAITKEGIITDIIICDSDEVAREFGAIPSYEGATIGAPYSPPPDPPTPEERLAQLESENALLKAQLQAQSDRSDFIEDCIAEMAMQVYAE